MNGTHVNAKEGVWAYYLNFFLLISNVSNSFITYLKQQQQTRIILLTKTALALES